MTDTPETDSVLNQLEHHLPNWLASEIMAAVARRLERERNILTSGLRDVMNSSDSTSMYRIAKAALNKVTGQE
jgi:hypothetical protein